METARYADFSMASSTLNTALLASVGEKNRNHLKTTFPALKLYMLSPRDIVDTMRAKHGVATSDDVSKLRDPLSRALTSLSDLTDHMDSFLLASQRLTRSGQGETDYRYFELFLETVSGFPSVPASMAGYYTQYPAIVDTSATGTKQCEAITNVAIRIMRIKGMDEQRKIKIDCVII
jgi:hypothetical protein